MIGGAGLVACERMTLGLEFLKYGCGREMEVIERDYRGSAASAARGKTTLTR